MRLTLLIPELIWPEPADQLTLGQLPATAFEWLAAHGERSCRPRQPFETALAQQFGVEDKSLGPLRLLGESPSQNAHDGCWLCADPVHLRFLQERIIHADAGAYDLDEAEAQAIVAALNDEFADVGQFHVASARRWYLRLNTPLEHPAEPISAVAGRRVDGEISDKNGVLTRWLNEVQMFLHGHPVNERRQNAGQPVVNSLWLWGAGELPQLATPPFTGVWSDNPLARGLGHASGLPVQANPAGLTELLSQTSRDSAPLVVLDSLLPPVLYEDSEGWRQAWQALENDWFAPLRNELGGAIDSVRIVGPSIYGELTFTVNAKNRWKFWRQSSSLSTIANELAEGKS